MRVPIFKYNSGGDARPRRKRRALAGVGVLALAAGAYYITHDDAVFAAPVKEEATEATLADAAFIDSAPLASAIELPISVNLKALEDRLNAEFPSRLADIRENNVVFVEGDKISWDSIECNGLKCRKVRHWTWLRPPVKGDVWGAVDRDGRITLSGDNGVLRLAIPIRASISGKLLGVQETAKAKAIIFVDLIPALTENWELTLEVRPDYRWTERPALKLFDVVKVTIGSQVDPKMREALAKLSAEMPAMLTELELREKAAEGWAKAQEPVEIAAEPKSRLEFRPTRAGYSGFQIENNIFSTVIFAEGATRLYVGDPPTTAKTPLPKLERIEPTKRGFAVNLPVAIDDAELTAAAKKALAENNVLELAEGARKGRLMVKAVDIDARADGKLYVAADLRYDNRHDWLKVIDALNLFDVEGRVTFIVEPALDAEARALTVKSMRVDARTDNKAADALIEIADLPGVRDLIAHAIRYEYGPEIDKALKNANGAFNQNVAEGARLSGALTGLNVGSFKIRKDRIYLIVEAEGKTRIEIGA